MTNKITSIRCNWPLDDDPRGIPCCPLRSQRGSGLHRLKFSHRSLWEKSATRIGKWWWKIWSCVLESLESTLLKGSLYVWFLWSVIPCDSYFCWCNSRFCLHFLSPFMSLSPKSTWWCPRNPPDFIWPKSLLKVPLINRYITTLKGIISNLWGLYNII